MSGRSKSLCPRSPRGVNAERSHRETKMAEQGGGAEDNILQFLPFVSRLDTGFWHELGHRKLEKYKLSEDQQQIHGYYSNCE